MITHESVHKTAHESDREKKDSKKAAENKKKRVQKSSWTTDHRQAHGTKRCGLLAVLEGVEIINAGISKFFTSRE